MTLFDDDSAGYAIHALNAVYLEGRWSRLDARGNKPGVAAQFDLDREYLAFPVRANYDEVDYPHLHAEPHSAIAQTLQANDDTLVMYRTRLPSALEVSFTVEIRPATLEDATQCSYVIRDSITDLCDLDHHGDADYIAAWLSNKTIENVRRWIAQTHFFVAESHGSIVGCAAMLPSGKSTLNYVAPQARLRGVSTALLRRLEETAQGLGLETCILESSRTALRFYEQRGYAHIGESTKLPLTGTSASIFSKRLG